MGFESVWAESPKRPLGGKKMAKKAAKGAAAKKKRTVSGKRGKPGKKTNQGVDPRGVAGLSLIHI